MAKATIATLRKEITALRKIVEQLTPNAARAGGMLSSTDFLDLVIMDDLENAKKHFSKRDWDQWKRKFIIAPFNPQRLTPFSYDLSVGAEVYSCNQQKVKQLTEDDDTYWIAPRETVVVKTEELVGLPPCYSATAWPRFKMVAEAIFQSMVKIDPTWFGQLGVAITNLSAAKYPIKRGDQFATLVLYELKTETSMSLCREEYLPEPTAIDPKGDCDHEAIRGKLTMAGLADICRIADGKLRMTQLPDADSFTKLMELDASKAWKSAVCKCIGASVRQMDALGLKRLSLIRPKEPKGKPLTQEEIRSVECTPSDLERAAIDHGRPFHLLPAIPDIVLADVEREIVPKIRAEIEASLFPKVVTLTLTVLGFLSLIIAVAAVVMDKYRAESPLADIDWPGTVVVLLVALTLVLLCALGLLLFRRGPHFQRIDRIRRDIKELKPLRSQYDALKKEMKRIAERSTTQAPQREGPGNSR